MKTTIEYLDEAKRKMGIESDYEMAKWLGMTPGAAYHYRHGRRVIDDYTAAKIAQVLEIDPMEVIAAANAEREKDEEKKDFWRKIFYTATAATVAFSVQIQKPEMMKNNSISESVYYVKSNERRQRSGWKWLWLHVLGLDRRKKPWKRSTKSDAAQATPIHKNALNFWASPRPPSEHGIGKARLAM